MFFFFWFDAVIILVAVLGLGHGGIRHRINATCLLDLYIDKPQDIIYALQVFGFPIPSIIQGVELSETKRA